MSYVAWKQLWPLVLPQVPLCAPPIVTKAIRNAVREFCDRTYVWKKVFSIPVGGSRGEYDLPSAANYAVCRLDAAVLAGTDLQVEAPERVTEFYPDWTAGTVTGQPSILTQLHPDTFWLVPFPASDQTVTLTVSLRPPIAAPKVDDWLIEEYEETIVAGALARLKSMTAVPWGNPAEAAAFARAFDGGCIDANYRASKAFGRAPIRTRAQFL